jgi:succinoglycan biosynthesis protein ExoM
VRVIVADNDDTPSARSLVDAAARDCRLDVSYIHAPARNISVARNACLDAATADLVAFIDDDERATEDWPRALLATLDETGADAVLGPVKAIYGRLFPAWIKDGDFHSPRPVWVGGELASAYSGNVLIRRESPPFRGLRFRSELGRSGGEDSFFFAQARQAGARLAYAPDAVVTEIVPAERARARWLLERYFRSGETHGLCLLHTDGAAPLVRARNAALAGAKALACVVMAGCNLAKAHQMMSWLLRGVMHLGVAARVLGGKRWRLGSGRPDARDATGRNNRGRR